MRPASRETRYLGDTKGGHEMSEKMVIVATVGGVRKVLDKWLSANMTCELVVSRNARRECCVEVVYDDQRSADLRTLLQVAKGEIIELR